MQKSLQALMLANIIMQYFGFAQAGIRTDALQPQVRNLDNGGKMHSVYLLDAHHNKPFHAGYKLNILPGEHISGVALTQVSGLQPNEEIIREALRTPIEIAKRQNLDYVVCDPLMSERPYSDIAMQLGYEKIPAKQLAIPDSGAKKNQFVMYKKMGGKP